MEYWDVYDKDKKLINKTVERGPNLKADEYHLVVNVWILNKDNKLLISQRIESKPHGLMWETTGGSVTKGENSLTGAIREAKEEVGITLKEYNGKLLGSTLRFYPNCNDILDVWLFKLEDEQEVTIQEEEVNDYKWATIEEIIKLNKENKFHTTYLLDEIIKIVK